MKMKKIVAVMTLPLAFGLLLTSGKQSAYAGGSTYYADHISMCEDPCGGLGERGCSCVKLPPIVVCGCS